MVGTVRIEIVADNSNDKGQAFETLMRRVLDALGQKVDRCNVLYAGTELDIEGSSIMGNVPYMAECKAHSATIDATMLRDFTGKYLPRMLMNQELRGYFFTLSDLSKGAKGYLQNEMYRIPGVHSKFIVFEQKDILDLMASSANRLVGDVATIQRAINDRTGLKCYDAKLLVTKQNLYWAQLVGPNTGGAPSHYYILDPFGTLLSDKSLVERLSSCVPELQEYIWLSDASAPATLDVPARHKIERVKKSSSWFDYQFPANPKFYVGRERELKELLRFAKSVRAQTTTGRTFIITGNSGMGKSSLGVQLEHVAPDNKLVVIPVDSRSCDGLLFVPACIQELVHAVSERTSEHLSEVVVAGLDSLPKAVMDLDRVLRRNDLVAVLVFDQFENVLYHKSIAKALRNLAYAVTDQGSRVILGFAWKSDMDRDKEDLERESRIVTLRSFGPKESMQILSRLETEIQEPLNRDLAARLREFSLGYPWLLKKICAHVAQQIETGYSQERLVNMNLNLKDLFEEDLAGLTDHDRHVLREIARRLPATQQSLMAAEVAEGHALQSYLNMFLDRRLLTRINDKFDVYSEIFREYLITGQIPFMESYILRMWPNPVSDMFSHLRVAGEFTFKGLRRSFEHARHRTVSEGHILNILRDMRVLDLATVSEGLVRLSDNPEVVAVESELDFATYVREEAQEERGCSEGPGTACPRQDAQPSNNREYPQGTFSHS